MQIQISKRECVLPEKCINCGKIFDLWYDLVHKDKESALDILEGRDVSNEFLCWDCKKINFMCFGK